MVEDPSISKVIARPTGQMELQGPWKSHDFRSILHRDDSYWVVYYYHYDYVMAVKW